MSSTRTPMLIALADATPATSGAKATPLASLLNAGLPVPPGFVVPTSVYQNAINATSNTDSDLDVAAMRAFVEKARVPAALVELIRDALVRIAVPCGEGPVVVRSSATTEDGPLASAAGQHDTYLGVRGAEQVANAVHRCWCSLWSTPAAHYREHHLGDQPAHMAVLVQPLVAADVAGVMFTGSTARIEASWGLGASVVTGAVTPDSWLLSNDHVVHQKVGTKCTRQDLVDEQIVTSQVGRSDREHFSLTDDQVVQLMDLGHQIEDLLGGPQDIEWAIVDGRVWILQARPITAAITNTPSGEATSDRDQVVLTGNPGSPGRATGHARTVRGPVDFARVRTGDILVCRTTDPAWTSLFSVVAAVVTETGGVLSHAAIVARELGIPAVLAVPNATTTLRDQSNLEVDGTNGTVILAEDSGTADPQVPG